MFNNKHYHKWDSFLQKYNLYYRQLSVKGKQKFCNRIHSVYLNLEVIGKENIEITPQIKAVICAYIVQLTFGLKHYWLYGYDYVHLYPSSFKHNLKGTTYNTKIIELSWQHFAEDYLQATNGSNVGLAQFALALIRTIKNGYKFDIHFGSYINEWFRIFKLEFKRKNPDLNEEDYEFDLEEQFARLIEYYFEKPSDFLRALPETFAHFSYLLNQNILNIEDDYKYKNSWFKKIKLTNPLPNNLFKYYGYKKWHYTYNLPLIGLIIAPIIIAIISENTRINLVQIIITLLTFAVLFFIGFKTYLTKIGLARNINLFALFSLTGFAPVFLTLLLLINFFTANFNKTESTHFVNSLIFGNLQTGNNHRFMMQFADNYLENYPLLRSFEHTELPAKLPQQRYKVTYKMAYGLLGMEVVKQKQILVTE